MTIWWPATSPLVLATLMFVAPAAGPAASVVETIVVVKSTYSASNCVPVSSTPTPLACANVSGAVRVMPVPPAPAVPTDLIVRTSRNAPVSMAISSPATRPVVLATLMFRPCTTALPEA